MIEIAVIDQSINGLFLYKVPEHYDSSQINEYIESQGRQLSLCTWGVFDGEIIDLRDEE